MIATSAAGGVRMAKRAKRKGKLSPLERDRNGVEVATQSDDRGPPERWQHMAYVDIKSDKGAATVRRALDVVPLDHYRRRGVIKPMHWIAGDKLREAWLLAGMQPSVVANLTDAVDRGLGINFAEATKDALTRCLRALRDVGPELSPVLVHVIYQEGTASQWAEQKGLRGRAAEQTGMVTLRLALDALMRHYGLRHPDPPAKPAAVDATARS